jgi:putative FmdB family regulatory protein
MPAYEYECAGCSRHFERRQKMSDAPITVCPECGGSVKRLISGGAGAITKGSGHAGSAERQACGFDGQNCGCCGEMACDD